MASKKQKEKGNNTHSLPKTLQLCKLSLNKRTIVVKNKYVKKGTTSIKYIKGADQHFFLFIDKLGRKISCIPKDLQENRELYLELNRFWRSLWRSMRFSRHCWQKA